MTDGLDSFSRPRFSPDGKILAASYTATGDKVYSLDRLAMITWPLTSAQPKILTKDFDRSVGTYAFAPNSQTIYFTAEDAGQENIYSIAITGGKVTITAKGATGVYTNLAIPEKASGAVILGLWESAINPAELVRFDLASKSHKTLTKFNVDRAASIDWRPLEHFSFTSKRGAEIHSMITLPPDFDENKKYPLLVLMHGGPHAHVARSVFCALELSPARSARTMLFC
ncbi:MAG: hypothetical protein WKF84_03880 [Pyrinomonadaceae bacterium]